MKKFLLVLPLLLLFSCSVQKRKYQNGFYVDWYNKTSKKEQVAVAVKKSKPVSKVSAPSETPVAEAAPIERQELSASSNQGLSPVELKKGNRLLPAPGDTCDVLVYKDGSEIKGTVLEVGTNEIKYKRCDTPEGPTYISRKTELFMIKYSNGTREVIKSEAPPQQLQTPASTGQGSTYKQANRYKRQTHPAAIAALVFGILAIVVAYIALMALVFGLLSTGLVFILPLIAALVAVVSGKTALNRIRAQPDIYKGRGMAIPGFIFGTVILGIYAMVLFIFLLFAGI